MELRRVLLLVAATLMVAACGRAPLPAGKACGANRYCPLGYSCVGTDGGTCMNVDGGADGPKSDGGRDAGAESDVAVPDGSQDDGGMVVPKVTVTIQLSGNGTITGDGLSCTTGSCTVTVDSGSSLVLVANPGADSNFNSWSGCTSNNGASCSLVAIVASMQLTATFSIKGANLVVQKDGSGSGTVTATWAGGGTLACGASCSAVVPKGTVVTFQGTPDMGSALAWGAPCTGSGVCMATIGDGETDVKATFTLNQVVLTVNHTGNGIIMSSGGITCSDPACPVQVNYGDSVTLTAAPGADSDFSTWTGCTSTTGAKCVVSSLKAAAAVTATFTLKKIQVTLSRSGNGTITSSDGSVNCTAASCVVSVDSGASLSLTATPGSDSNFESWSGCTTTSGATCTLTGITAPVAASATFALKNASFNIAKNGNGAGTVAASWTGGGSLNCGTGCSASIPLGTSVTVTATPQTGSSAAIVGCATNPCTVTVAAGGTTVTATFTLNQYVLAVTLGGPAGTGSVLSAAGISCGATCSALVNYGTAVSLSATASSTGVFTGWSGCTPTGSSPCSVSVTGNTNVTANFRRANGAACGTGSDCISGNFCVVGVCCGGPCTGPCNTGTCPGGTCANKTGKPVCGFITGPSGPQIGTDVAEYCDGNGACVAPTIICTGFSSVSCPLANNTCCNTSPSSSYVCVAPSSCLTPNSGDFFSGWVCITGADCPDNYDCCNQPTIENKTTGYWSSCVATGTCNGTVQH
jgi:hypothetical protein